MSETVKLPPAPDMPEVITSVLAALEAEDTWRSGKLHASDLGAGIPGGFGCLRKLWLRVHGVKGNPLSPGQRLLLEWAKGAHIAIQGWLAHEVAVEALAAQGWEVVGIEEDVTDGGGDGRLDVLLRQCCLECDGWGYFEDLPTQAGDQVIEETVDCSSCEGSGGVLLVWDIKTMKGAGFHFLQRANAAKPEHIAQVRHYMMKTGAALGCVSYFDREGSRFMWHSPTFGRDDASVEALWTRLRTHVERPEPPDPLPPKVTKDGPALPAPCSYSTANGDVFTCPFLDTEHCPGAVPVEQRPKQVLVSAGMKWVVASKPAPKKKPTDPPPPHDPDLLQALKESIGQEKRK